MTARRKRAAVPDIEVVPTAQHHEPRIVAFGRSGATPLRLKARLVAAESQTLHEGDEAAGLSLALWACVPEGWVASLEIDAREAAAAHAVRLDDLEGAVAWAGTAARSAFESEAWTTARRAADSLPRAAEHALRRFARARLARRTAAEAVAMAERLVRGLAVDGGRTSGRP